MNKSIVALAALLALALPLAGAPSGPAQQQFSYSKVVEFSSSSKIELQNIEDFSRIARENRIKDIFFNDKYFAYSLNSSLYQFKCNGYSSIDDYLAGQRTKFPNGRLYYIAQGNKLKTVDEALYFDKEYFSSGDDYRKALASGFVGKADAEKTKKFYGLISRADLVGNMRAVAWVCFALGSEAQGADAKAFNPDPDAEKIAEWSKGAFKKLLSDVFLMEVSVEDKARAKSSGKEAEAPKKGFFQSDAILYYLATIAKYPAYDQFSKRNLKQRTNVVGNDKMLEGLKMVSIEELGQAIAAGYSFGDEYRIGKFYELKNKAQYDARKGFVAKLEERRAAYGLRSRDQAALAYLLQGQQVGVPLPIDLFVENANAALLGDPEFVAMQFKKTSAKGVDALFASNARLAEEYGYVADAKVIQRKIPAPSYPPSNPPSKPPSNPPSK